MCLYKCLKFCFCDGASRSTAETEEPEVQHSSDDKDDVDEELTREPAWLAVLLWLCVSQTGEKARL